MRKLVKILFIACFLCISTANAETLSYVPENATRALIIIHGYGGNGRGMQWMTDHLKKALPDMAFYYPTAPDNAPTGGKQWFVIPVLGEEIKDKALYDKMMADAMHNVKVLHEVVEEIHQDLRIPYQNIYVSGFSQGGLMALLTTLTNPHNLPVAVSFSGVPLLLTPDFTAKNVVAKPDILLLQGNRDTVIPKDSMNMSTATLKSLGIEPQVQEIGGMSHQINQKALKTAIEFME